MNGRTLEKMQYFVGKVCSIVTSSMNRAFDEQVNREHFVIMVEELTADGIWGTHPYNDELVALAKHYRNIWVDLCWAWSIDPYSSRDFLRRFIHAVPINKIFAFGGDTGWPTSSMAYAIQARNEIRRALEAEAADGYMTEKDAMWIATRIMRDNQFDCFDVEGTRTSIQQAV